MDAPEGDLRWHRPRVRADDDDLIVGVRDLGELVVVQDDGGLHPDAGQQRTDGGRTGQVVGDNCIVEATPAPRHHPQGVA